MSDQFKELLLLRLRSAIADKEWVIAQANRETHHGDFWTCDWNQGVQDAESEIQSLIQQILNL